MLKTVQENQRRGLAVLVDRSFANSSSMGETAWDCPYSNDPDYEFIQSSRQDHREFAGARMTYLSTAPLNRTRERPLTPRQCLPSAIVQLSGRSTFEQFGRHVTLTPDSFVFFDRAAPCEATIELRSDQILVRFPATAFAPRQIWQASAQPVDLAKMNNRMFAPQVAMIWHTLPGLAIEQHGAALSVLIATAMLADPFQPEHRAIDLDPRVKRIEQLIECRLGDEDLDAAQVADILGLSRRYADLIFRESNGYTITAWVWERRLQCAKEQLKLANGRSASVTTIAFDIGFKSTSHFSRLFKKRFGMSPVEYRNSAWLRGGNVAEPSKTISTRERPSDRNRRIANLVA